MWGQNNRIPMQAQRPIKPKGADCKIKIKNTSSGKQIEFSGNCTKEQLEMAKMNLGESEEYSEDD